MTSFLFQFQFSQKISQFSISKFTKILRQHTPFLSQRNVWYLVLLFPFLIRFSSCGDVPCHFLAIFYSLYVDILDLFGCCILVELLQSLPVGLYQSLFFVCFLSWTKPMVFILSGFFLFSFSYLSVVILSEFVCCSWTYAKFATVFILSGIGFAKKCSLKVCVTVFILLGFVVAIQVLYTVVVWYLWSQ